MNETQRPNGFSLIEMLISLVILGVVMVVMATLMIDNSRINKEQHMQIQAQSTARTTLSLVTQVLRTAGWDPSAAGIPVVALDSDTSDSIETLDVFADLNGDGDTADLGEAVTIRHIADRVEWRRQTGGSFEIVGIDITNDEDGDGIPELMFTPDATPDPTRITVRITAGGTTVDPVTGEVVRYTVSNDVVLRNTD